VRKRKTCWEVLTYDTRSDSKYIMETFIIYKFNFIHIPCNSLTIQIFGRITTSNYVLFFMPLLRVCTPRGHIQFGRRPTTGLNAV
jgi:hypothetical protein